jgi:bifunctional DNA-binding transcriptional regulator/antitoxin component of YhaV-PrlF toxin-antitoxin module
MAAAAGYSGTPLAQKLGIKPGSEVVVLAGPEGYRKLLAPLPEGVRFVARVSETTDIVHVFATRKQELAKTLKGVRPKLRFDGAVWVSWPKKAAKVATDITEDTIREVALPLGFVDIKVCAVDETWSGLKLVIRKELRKA